MSANPAAGGAIRPVEELMSASELAGVRAWLADKSCPGCNATGSLRVETRLVAKPLGSYSIAGAQDKVVASETPTMVCSAEGCDFAKPATRR